MRESLRTAAAAALVALSALLAACAREGGAPGGKGAQQGGGYASPTTVQGDDRSGGKAPGGGNAQEAGAAVPDETGGQVLEVAMALSEMKYEPSRIETLVGTTVEITATNVGQVLHDLIIDADEGELEVELRPGESKTVAVTFKYPGTYKFKCEQPGHTELGMAGEIVVQGEGTPPALAKTDRKPVREKTPFLVTLADGGFSPAELSVEARSLLQGQAINLGRGAHEFAVDGKIATLRVPLDPGRSTAFGIKYRVPGDYPIRCLKPGHPENGVLHVTGE